MSSDKKAALPVVEPSPAPEFVVTNVGKVEVQDNLVVFWLCRPEGIADAEDDPQINACKVKLLVQRVHVPGLAADLLIGAQTGRVMMVEIQKVPH